ncbi:MAG: NAD(+)/NADH kinase [Firmicutes bacterium]|nr:NAD(+)/NADH kinase [Bacillota bacterium]
MKHVILTPNPYRDTNFQTVRAAMKVLKDAGMEPKLCLPFEVDRSYELPKDLRFHKLDRELQNAELVVCFGGDGTILHMAKAATRKNVPILGVNIGTMGFMAELESTELDQLARLAKDDYVLDRRMMLDVVVQRDRDIIFHDIGLNDVVITKGAIARITHLAVKCDGVEAIQCGGDGVIVATPTGSTAYSLSAGGPIVEPEANNILITPICAHDVMSRCIVASDRRTITVELVRNARRNAYLSVDGGKALRLNMGDVVTIKRSPLQTKLIRLKDRSFYDVVNMKFKKIQG